MPDVPFAPLLIGGGHRPARAGATFEVCSSIQVYSLQSLRLPPWTIAGLPSRSPTERSPRGKRPFPHMSADSSS
ncbi:hypothetical protein EI94DRAFT_1748309 [Lactarius quietus]|nr:hypothetical protein EI94DRAFT_1748309 [Lactarius quietus]